MENPFEAIQRELVELKEMFAAIPKQTQQAEIISREELMRRLDISEPTVIKMVRKGQIPEIKIGQICRYDWSDVIETLKNKSAA